MMNIEEAIEILTKLITEDVDSVDALRLTQAALNLAHVKATLALTDAEHVSVS